MPKHIIIYSHGFGVEKDDSQGCLVAAIANPETVRSTLFLAPPDNVDVERFKNVFDRPGAVINLDGQSRLARKDGSITIVPKDYWDSLKPLNVMKLYDMFSQRTKLTIVEADEDDVLGSTDFTKTDERIGLQHLRADHNFTGDARQQLIGLVRKQLL